MGKRSRKATSDKREAATRRPNIPIAAQPVITIRTHDGKTLVDAAVMYAKGPLIERLALEWGYILRVRTRWCDDRDLRLSFGERAAADLHRLGIAQAALRQLVSAQHIEVELHEAATVTEETARIRESASEIPWEYLLSAATRALGRYRPMLITRLIRKRPVRKSAQQFMPSRPGNLLFVESAPGRLYDEYGFESEQVRIQAAVGLPDVQIARMQSPALSELKREARAQSWEAIHVTGVDTHQVIRYIPDLYDDIEEEQPDVWKRIADRSGRVRDGMILRQPEMAELPVSYQEFADALIDLDNPPSVVTLNLYHSGARTARELVAHGAFAALGFLDEIDDDAAELFFQGFYSNWCNPKAPKYIPAAFLAAWHEMDFDGLHGTAIVIWMGHSVFEPIPLRQQAESLSLAASDAEPTRAQDDTPIDKLIQVEFEVDDQVNYSLLHNDRQFINKLTLTKLVREDLHDIGVTVELNLGDQNYPYRSTHLLFKEKQLALAHSIRVPLTATLPRTLRERVQSVVYVKVTCGGRTAFEDTRRVTLLPVDEWLDDTVNNPWLPSFVLPRDPAILKIINSARQYLIGIADDPAAGFDGYQSVDEDLEDPSAGVDDQVQAIWTAIVNEYRLQYINPPPAYSLTTQRLRTPSDIVASNTGTCIDLALLLASTLEYIDIYPVIVLLSGHAFVGYWRSEEAHEEFATLEKIPRAVPAVGSREARSAGLPYVDRFGWRLTKLNYDEIMKYVMSHKLVMLEATHLTGAYKFSEARKEGRHNLRNREEFDSLLDLHLARAAATPVTPLPIINE